MKSLSSIDLAYLLSEMKFLEGARVDKIYHPRQEELVFCFHVSSKGKQLLRIVSGKYLFLSSHKGRSVEPSGFCMYLRKKIGNDRLLYLSQVGSERIVLLEFKSLKMYIELFGKGNIVLVDSDDVILNALNQKMWSDRSIRKKEKYLYPKKRFNIFTMKEREFIDSLRPGKEIVLQLAKELGVGGSYAEEICLRAGIDKDRKRLSESDLKKLFLSFKKIRDSAIDSRIVHKNKKMFCITPFPFQLFSSLEFTTFDSFNAAYDQFYVDEFGSDSFVSQHQEHIDKVKNIVTAQQRQITQMEKKVSELTRKGELIYENYQMLSDLIAKGSSVKVVKPVKKVNAKSKSIVVEV